MNAACESSSSCRECLTVPSPITGSAIRTVKLAGFRLVEAGLENKPAIDSETIIHHDVT